MSENHHTSSGGGYEKRDVNVAKVALFTFVLLAIFGLAGYLVPYYVFRVMNEDHQQSDAAPPLYEPDQLAPGPRLQVREDRDLRDRIEAERALLSSWEWIDRDNGVVRVPIERAMDLVAERGLPQRPDVKEEAVAAAAREAGAAKKIEQGKQP